MNISKQLARNIVKNLKDVLKQEINFIDTEGIIIASTDEERIRTLHEGQKSFWIRKKKFLSAKTANSKERSVESTPRCILNNISSV